MSLSNVVAEKVEVRGIEKNSVDEYNVLNYSTDFKFSDPFVRLPIWIRTSLTTPCNDFVSCQHISAQTHTPLT